MSKSTRRGWFPAGSIFFCLYSVAIFWICFSNYILSHQYISLWEPPRETLPHSATTSPTNNSITPHEEGHLPLKTKDLKDRLETASRLQDILHLDQAFLLSQYPIDTLPQWNSDIVSRYGSEPKILGLETCETFRQHTQKLQEAMISPLQIWLAPAGLFHTGTNLISQALVEGCLSGRVSVHHQVPWGKHNPLKAREEGYRPDKANYKVIETSNVLPIVMVRHPMDWMRSMARQPYAAKWNHTIHDPMYRGNNPVSVGFFEKTIYPNLLDFWKTWNEDYLDAPQFPRLVVRLEDLVFFPHQTLSQICSCAGGKYRPHGSIFQYKQGGTVRRNAKHNIPLVDAWIRHGSVESIEVNSVLMESLDYRQVS